MIILNYYMQVKTYKANGNAGTFCDTLSPLKEHIIFINSLNI